MTDFMTQNKSDFSWNITFSSLQDLLDFGVQFGLYLDSGLVLALNGDLGSGKTTLIRSLCQGLGCSSLEFVTSPTFVLMQEYQGRFSINHLDVYRLNNATQFVDFGGMELFNGDGIVLIEWAEKIKCCLPKQRIEITLKVVGENERRVSVSFSGGLILPALSAYLDKLAFTS